MVTSPVLLHPGDSQGGTIAQSLAQCLFHILDRSAFEAFPTPSRLVDVFRQFNFNSGVAQATILSSLPHPHTMNQKDNSPKKFLVRNANNALFNYFTVALAQFYLILCKYCRGISDKYREQNLTDGRGVINLVPQHSGKDGHYLRLMPGSTSNAILQLHSSDLNGVTPHGFKMRFAFLGGNDGGVAVITQVVRHECMAGTSFVHIHFENPKLDRGITDKLGRYQCTLLDTRETAVCTFKSRTGSLVFGRKAFNHEMRMFQYLNSQDESIYEDLWDRLPYIMPAAFFDKLQRVYDKNGPHLDEDTTRRIKRTEKPQKQKQTKRKHHTTTQRVQCELTQLERSKDRGSTFICFSKSGHPIPPPTVDDSMQQLEFEPNDSDSSVPPQSDLQGDLRVVDGIGYSNRHIPRMTEVSPPAEVYAEEIETSEQLFERQRVETSSNEPRVARPVEEDGLPFTSLSWWRSVQSSMDEVHQPVISTPFYHFGASVLSQGNPFTGPSVTDNYGYSEQQDEPHLHSKAASEAVGEYLSETMHHYVDEDQLNLFPASPQYPSLEKFF
ncbi:hypothetical protein PROFUN_06548 [Planoprotostelium fungivorum]|uniref:Uncharacterized protein n=1 Tax=Planoprotostelium fungivorum TaxID=1890364 RepID=A0A2P6MRT6_9EUKA|nr:hypothetical protein PROFUN_06548 [Planoprotostelium fungivorum]